MPNQTEPDLTGRRRLVRSVLSSWAGHLVLMLIGFVVPRMVDQRIGQDSLGVWDFGWSLLSYSFLLSGGVLSSVSKYVSQYRAVRDARMLNTTINTGMMLYICASGLLLASVLTVSLLLPRMAAGRFGLLIGQAQWVILLLGLSIVVQYLSAVFSGVLVACHWWGTHNALHALGSTLAAAGILLVLGSGGGLIGMAASVLASEVVVAGLRILAAKRACPEMRVSLRCVRKDHTLELLSFGGKSFLAGIANLLLYQTNSILIAAYLGPGALAVFARPMALVRHVRTLVRKLAHVLTPVASGVSAQATEARSKSDEGQHGLAELFVKGTRYSLLIALPGVLLLALVGRDVMLLWMGPRYADGLLIAVFAIGSLIPISQEGTFQILVGIGRHGMAALVRLAAAIVAIVSTVLCLGVLKGGLVGTAVAMTIPLTLANGIVIAPFTCRLLKLPLWDYVARAALVPLLVAVPFALGLVVASMIWHDSPVESLGWGMAWGSVLAAPLYVAYALPSTVRRRIARVWGCLAG